MAGGGGKGKSGRAGGSSARKRPNNSAFTAVTSVEREAARQLASSSVGGRAIARSFSRLPGEIQRKLAQKAIKLPGRTAKMSYLKRETIKARSQNLRNRVWNPANRRTLP